MIKSVYDGSPASLRQQLFDCEQFVVWRLTSDWSFVVGKENTPRVVVCLEGGGELEYVGEKYTLSKGDVLLLPAIVGACIIEPLWTISVLEISIPEEK